MTCPIYLIAHHRCYKQPASVAEGWSLYLVKKPFSKGKNKISAMSELKFIYPFAEIDPSQ